MSERERENKKMRLRIGQQDFLSLSLLLLWCPAQGSPLLAVFVFRIRVHA